MTAGMIHRHTIRKLPKWILFERIPESGDARGEPPIAHICGPTHASCLEISCGGVPQFFSIFTRIPGQANLRSYEHELEDSSIFGKAIRPWIQYAWFTFSDMRAKRS